MNNTLSKLGGLLLMGLASASADAANTVKFSQGTTINADAGSTFTVDLVGEDFTISPDGAAFSLTWDPSVLTFVSGVAANPPWDISFIDVDYVNAGLIDYAFLNRTTTDSIGANFSLASFTFDFIGGIEVTTTLDLEVDVFNTGFLTSFAQPIAVNFVDTQVIGPPAPTASVPAPATPWLLAFGIPALLNRARRRNAGSAS